ncbi:MAG: hypothetical protein ACOYL5_11750 [Phototrophicaceae bacterium]
MTAIITLLYGLQGCQNRRERQTLAKIIVALLCVTGRITGTSLARALEGEMSRRTLQRWMQRSHDWAGLLWGVAGHRLKPQGVCHNLEQCPACQHDHEVQASLQAIENGVKTVALAHADQTGSRVNESLHWLHTFSTPGVHPKRGKVALVCAWQV